MRGAAVIVVLGFLVAAGCAPIAAGVGIINANIAISAAKTAGAEQHAVYEYTAALEYLQKAREENGYSDFAKARVYADRALKYAKDAKKKARAVSEAEQPVVLPSP